MRKTLERSGPLWVPSRREMLGALGVGLLAPRIARAATFAVVASSAIAYNSDGAGILTTATIDTTGADLLVLALASHYPSSPDYDSKGNLSGWTALIGQGSDPTCRLWYCVPSSVGSGHYVRLNGGSCYGTCYFAAFSGANQTAPFDNENGATSTGTTISPGSITPSMSNELVISAVAGPGGGLLPGIDSSMTLLAANLSSDGYYRSCGWAYKIQTTPAAINPIWTVSSSQNQASVIASFKPTSSSVGSTAVRHRVTGGN